MQDRALPGAASILNRAAARRAAHGHAATPTATVRGGARSAMLCGNCQALVRELTGQSAPQTWLKQAVPAGLGPVRVGLGERGPALPPAARSTQLPPPTLSRLARVAAGAHT